MKNKGFTLVELLISLGIIILLLAIVLASIKKSKEKAVDAEVKKTVSEIALKAEGQDIAPGVIDYQSAFNSINATETLAQIAAKQGLSYGSGLGSYDYSFSASDYAILFPLKKGGYYCIDSYGNATGKDVVGQFQTTGAKTCATATRTTVPTNTKPVITLNGANPVGYTVYAGNYTYRGSPVYGILPADWPEISYTAYDVEDGDLTASVLIEYPDGVRMTHLSLNPIQKSIVWVAKILTPESALAAKGGGCLAQSERHYYVTDSNGNVGHAYRGFTSVC
ncbi:MAG: prepilin-type N-terminal cleavage/methylation domain-containing protein [Candidatus Pacebacteria bacterium]|nr:prepilin-type N-terminal cleavage/methylation domain-containing protein [Candidatus Paceibacterota bacterium]